MSKTRFGSTVAVGKMLPGHEGHDPNVCSVRTG